MLKHSILKCCPAFLIFFTLLAIPSADAQLSNQAQAQISQEAASLANEPAMLAVTPLAQGTAVGKKSEVQISLLNADNRPVAAKSDSQYEVTLQSSSGSLSSQKVWIKKGESSTHFQFVPDAAGLTTVTVRPTANDVRPDRTNVLIVPSSAKVKRKVIGKPTSRLWSYPHLDSTARLQQQRIQLRQARFELSPFDANPAQIQRRESGNSPRLHIRVNDVEFNHFANGKDGADISAYFQSADGTPAPRDINLWFSMTGGRLDQNPLRIQKGSFSASAPLTSAWAKDVHVRFVNSNPSYEAEGDTEFDVHFIPRFMKVLAPNELSVVDNVPVMVVFFNEQGSSVAPGKDWQVTLRSKQSKLRFTPTEVEIKQSAPLGSSMLAPLSFGTDVIEAVASGYNPAPLTIVITGWMVLGLCWAGGVAGGMAAFNKFGGSWFWRIFLGILGGVLLCWLYVYLALPNVTSNSLRSNIAHNRFSVFFVAVIGGYAGTAVLDLAAKQLGLLAKQPANPG